MIVERVINGVEIEVDIEKGNEIYFEEEFANKIVDSDVDSILELLYKSIPSIISPLSMTWEITSICNFNCLFCYINQNGIPKKTTKFKDAKEDIDYLISNGLLICYLTGGEILGHPDFLEIYMYLKKNGVLVALLTNLSLLNKEHLDVLSKYKPYKIVASLYGVSREQFKKVTSQELIEYDKILANILELKKRNIDIRCQTPVNRLTENELTAIAEWCYSNDIPYHASDELLSGYNNKQDCEEVRDKRSFRNTYSKLDRISIAKSIETVNFDTVGYRKHFDCRSGKYYFVFTYDYKIRPCFVFYGPQSKSFLVKNGIRDALERMTAYISRYKGKIIDYCNGCYAHQLCNECIFTQSNQLDLKTYMNNICQKNNEKMIEIQNEDADLSL